MLGLKFLIIATLFLPILAQNRRCQARCNCSSKRIPFCGTDGVTYRNICVLQCTQRSCNRALGIKFEGECSKKYIHDSGKRRYQRSHLSEFDDFFDYDK